MKFSDYKRITLEIWPDRGLRCGLRFEHEDCSFSWSWYGALADLRRFLVDGGALVDIQYHAAYEYGLLRVFRLEETRGGAELRGYAALELPCQLAAALVRGLDGAACLLSTGHWHGEGYERGIKLDLTAEIRAASRYYGAGKGTVRIEYSTPEIEASVRSWRLRCERFAELCERVETIARNSTGNVEEVAVCQYRYDSAGFVFVTPSLWGGIINHGTDENPDWSIHT